MSNNNAPTAGGHLLVAVLAAGGISVSLMQTLVIPLIPQLPTLLDTSPANASWAITATLLTGAIATPVLGRLGDMYGPKHILCLCAGLLVAGSVIAALTSSLIPLIIGRGLQGFGAPVIPLGISVLRAALPAERVGSAMGLMSASLGVGGALGLPLSAVIAEHFSWHALFWCAAALGTVSGILFAALVPAIAPVSSDRFDPLGTLGLAAGLVLLLLPISKGSTWGWANPTTLGMLAAAAVTFTVFGWWQLRAPSPIVDVRTTLKRPVLLTNLSSIAVGFGMFAMSLVAPQLLQMPSGTGYGLGQSMVAAGLWMAPGGLAMMLAAPMAARVISARGPKFTLVTGSTIIAAGYLLGTQLLGSAAGVLVFSVIVSTGVGFAFASLPALINSAVPVSETGSANGINTLARSLGTSTSSAVMSAVLAGMTVNVAGHILPSLNGFRTALLIAALAAAGAALIALAIPAAARPRDISIPVGVADPVAPRSGPVPATRTQVRDLEAVLAALGLHSALGPHVDGGVIAGARWLDRSAYLVLSRIQTAGAAVPLTELAHALNVEPTRLSTRLAGLVREGLVRAEGPGNPAAPSRFSLTPRGHDQLNRQRTTKVEGLQRAVADWDEADITALIGYLGRFTDSVARRHDPTPAMSELDTVALHRLRPVGHRGHPHRPDVSRPHSGPPPARTRPDTNRARWVGGGVRG
ncbi:MFS transporter [Mycobacterium sp. 21AC1]|uniref:MFS transporter n=1 Tax=[Mycobacterium] appelbergii TaxID=2939269 RepID=UPI002938E719|nr:MFS transporter [Mycobacterium sp. 21AC1]MDV3123728.1 MFS transporter [Mycobacterium sp. 21AC1]